MLPTSAVSSVLNRLRSAANRRSSTGSTWALDMTRPPRVGGPVYRRGVGGASARRVVCNAGGVRGIAARQSHLTSPAAWPPPVATQHPSPPQVFIASAREPLLNCRELTGLTSVHFPA